MVGFGRVGAVVPAAGDSSMLLVRAYVASRVRPVGPNTPPHHSKPASIPVVSGLRTYLTPVSQDMVYSLTTSFTRVDSGAERESWLSTAGLGVQ
jgi:hypothetical protein